MEKTNEKMEFLEKLNSENTKDVLIAIEEIKKTGNVEYIPFLIEKLNASYESEIGKEILKFLHTIKDKKATGFYIGAIQKTKNKKILKELVQFCWESGFDLSPYGETFIKVLIEEDYEIAIEAFSVLEENLIDFSEEQRKEHTKYLKEKLSSLEETKKALIVELIKLLDN